MAKVLSDIITRYTSQRHLPTTSPKVCGCSDRAADCCSHCSISEQCSPSDSWTDDQVLERTRTAPALPDAIFPGCDQPLIGHKVRDLCPDTVAKVGDAWHIATQAQALDFVRSTTSIPVPKVRRCFNAGPVDAILLLEKIEGTRLDRL
jgi:hypothetical protein